MSNNDLLTEEEFARYTPNRRLVERLEACRTRFGLTRQEFHVVDWGCGRGLFVLWLREQGYPAIGVDIDSRPFANGADLFLSKGHRPEDSLFPLDRRGSAPCRDASMHFVTSWQTLEHVEDPHRTAQEIARVTIPGGGGIHIFPAHRRVLEPHLFMPFVHWLPKNRLRLAFIAAFVRLGIEPRWWPDGSVPRREMAATYYRYSVDETFYRPPRAILSCFEAHGLEADFLFDPPGRRVPRQLRRFLAAWHRHFGPDVALVTRRS